jgi:hypothetical protein
MFNSTVIEALQEAGVTLSKPKRKVAPLDQSQNRPDFVVELNAGGRVRRFAVEVRTVAPYPAQTARLDHLRAGLRKRGNPLLYAPHITEGQGRALTAHGWSWVDELGNFDLRAEGILLRNRVPKARGEGRRSSHALPKGWAGLQVVRTLIVEPPEPVRTSTLARAAGISAARTSQVLHQLQTHSYVSKESDGSWDVDRITLLDLFLAEYPGPGGDQGHFYALDIGAAARAIAGHQELEPAISGDVAADLLAPRRRPSHLIAYLHQGSIDESDTLVVSVATEANVIVIRPFDTSVFPVKQLKPSTMTPAISLAHPTQVAWDLQRLGGQDRLEHLEELKAWILRSP